MTQNHSERMRRLLAAGLLPERAGQPVKAWVHVSLAELRAPDAESALQGEWITTVRAKWAAHRAAASVAGGDGAAWLDGDAARAVTCDAVVTPVVTGEVDPSVLDDLVGLCAELAKLDHQPDQAQPGSGPDRGQAREMLQHAIIGKTTILLLHSQSAFDL